MKTDIPYRERYRQKIVTIDEMVKLIKPGHRIFLSSGPATPVFSVKGLLESKALNLQDLEIIQLITILDDPEHYDFASGKFRLKTFNVGESISKEVMNGNIDFIPANLIEIPAILATRAVGVDVAIIQATPPDERGFMRLGVAIDVAAIVMKNASIVIAEINPNVPCTYGETLVHTDNVSCMIESDLPLLELPRKTHDTVTDRIGWHVSNLIHDGSTVALHAGRIYDAVAKHLEQKRNLGVLTHVITDWVIRLVESGAVSLERNRLTGGMVTTSYAFGTRELYDYVDRNPVFEFHPIAILANPFVIRRVHRLASIMNVKKIDVTGEAVIFHSGDNLLSGYESKLNFAVGATFSRNGRAIVALRAMDKNGRSNIVIQHSTEDTSRVRSTLGVTRFVVTEYGVANLFGKSIRERVLAMIDIAHPEHREKLLAEAKTCGYAYRDQIYVSENAKNYPVELETRSTFKDGLEVKFRPIKSSDEDMMRRLFYQFSDESKYFRYFVRKPVMPHREMQPYVNIDYQRIVALVGVIEMDRTERIIAEARYAYDKNDDSYETAFIVDEQFQGKGLGTFMLNYLIKIAQDRGLKQLSAYILPENRHMIHVFDKACIHPESTFEDGVMVKRITITDEGACELK